MQAIIMAIAVIRKGDQILIRKTDPSKNPYSEPWALFGGKIIGSESVEDEMNNEFLTRWNISLQIKENLWWDSEIKNDNDGETKRFIYLDVLCEIDANSSPSPTNSNEQLQWVDLKDLDNYELNPPSKTLLTKLQYI